MRLLFVWIGDIGRDISNQCLNFADDYDISYNSHTKELVINKRDTVLTAMYGRNILGIDLLVGRNGSGKSSIMNLLGLNTGDRINEFGLSEYNGDKDHKKNWFAVYHLQDNKFAIEGYNNKVLKLLDSAGWLKPQYSVWFSYDFETNKIDGYFDTMRQEDFHCLYMLYDATNSRSWYTRRVRRKSIAGVELLAYRSYLSSPGYVGVFEYLRKATLEETLPGNMEIVPMASRLTIRMKDDVNVLELNNDAIKMRSLAIYGKTGILWPEPISFEILGYKYEAEDIRRYFIIHYLEMTLVSLIQKNNFQSEYHDEENLYDYSSRKKYLLGAIEKLTAKQEVNGYIVTAVCVALEGIAPQYFFIEDKTIRVPMNDDKADSVWAFLALLDEYNDYLGTIHDNPNEDDAPFLNHMRFFEVSYGQMSSGEMELINLYATIYKGLSVWPNVSRETTGRSCILLLDEPDCSFHPEWSRQLVSTLTTILNEPPFSDYYYQIIITTHSPIILSDIPRQHIHCCERRDDKKISFRLAEFGFMSNINDIMKESFFITFPCGEFSKQYVDKLLKKLDEFEKKFTATDNKFTDISTFYEELLRQSEIIDEPIVRNHIQNRLNNLLYRSAREDNNTDLEKSSHFEEILKHLTALRKLERKND
ncbi:MAG: AAA family ATPase [Selenomonadaceae bacterium]|nr:AAA family ATPase [Selenomonadaceae bacterium]